jgi:glycerophosphoryl diester phosphodiesterase
LVFLEGKKKPYIMAHRGNPTVCPENTLASFAQAIRDGADILETDLHLTRDGEFVCIHDATVDRTTDGTGPVAEKTLEELKKLRAGHGFESYSEERIPGLKEVIPLVPAHVALALELKTDSFLDPAVCRRLVDLLKDGRILERTFVISFSLPRIQAVKAMEPAILNGWITLSRKRPIKGPDLLGPAWPLLIRNPLYVFWAHLQGQAVCALDEQADSRLWLYRLLGCDAVLTNDSGKTARKLKKRRF